MRNHGKSVVGRASKIGKWAAIAIVLTYTVPGAVEAHGFASQNAPRSIIGDTRANLSDGNFPVGHIELRSNSLYANNLGITSHEIDRAQKQVTQINNPDELVLFRLIQAALVLPQPNAVVMRRLGALLDGLAFLPGGLDLFSSLPGASLLRARYGKCSRCSCPGFSGSGSTCSRSGCGHHYDQHW
jgi:hypothetical protein